jgi:hypothetical protein
MELLGLFFVGIVLYVVGRVALKALVILFFIALGGAALLFIFGLLGASSAMLQ